MIKKFEEYNMSNKYPFSWYKGKWYIHYDMNHEYNWCDKLGALCFIEKVINNNDSNHKFKPIKIRGKAIHMDKKFKMIDSSKLVYSYTIGEFNKLDFLTTEELYFKNTDMFISIFYQVVDQLNSKELWVDWYKKRLELVFSLFGPVLKRYPEAKDANKFNL